MPDYRGYLKWIMDFWKPHRKHLAALVLFTLVSSAVALSFPLVFRYLLDNVQEVLGETGVDDSFRDVILILGALALARFIAGLYPGARAWLNSKIGRDVRDRVFQNLLKKDYRFWNAFRPGDLTTRLSDDIVDYPRIAWFSCSAVFRALESSSRLIFCLGVMFFMSWELSLIALVPLPVMFYIFTRVENRLGKKVEASRKATSHTGDLLDSTFAGIPIIKAYSAEKGQARRLRELLDTRLGIDLSITKLVTLLHSLYSILGQLGKVTVMFVGGLFVIWDRIGIGEFYAFYVYLDMLLAPMMDIPNLFVTSRQAFTSIDREREILNYPDAPERTGTRGSGPVRELKMREAGFRYPGSGDGIAGLDFHLKGPGIYAVVGEVGSGKSTLLKLLTGLVPCTEGSIHLNGMELGEVSQDYLVSQIGYVPQESVLFSQSVGDNVKLGRDLNDETVSRCLETAGLDGTELGAGAKTELGQGGTGVSGGQKQRVAIARALAGNPSLLLFDDCTAALDAEKEDAFWRALENVRSDAMVLVVSHRLATVKRSNRVLFLHRGRQKAFDSHENLIESSRLYRLVLSAEM
ncbi:MAG: ATP-binding cassette domain-containing protein, partial [Candidatus Aegiribacteria sp.]|nr:ATP-binding cassette domain-containing protein [Candidatus Aegiribacteria sp.]MBD3294225.1 ATP-binding cassette domain-containing protein [Candidatus Fermentibacteria bacterium]